MNAADMEQEERPRYPRVTIRQESWSDEPSHEILYLTFSRLEAGELHSFQYAVPFTAENFKGLNDAAAILRLDNSGSSMDTLQQFTKNMVALANGIQLVARRGFY